MTSWWRCKRGALPHFRSPIHPHTHTHTDNWPCCSCCPRRRRCVCHAPFATMAKSRWKSPGEKPILSDCLLSALNCHHILFVGGLLDGVQRTKDGLPIVSLIGIHPWTVQLVQPVRTCYPFGSRFLAAFSPALLVFVLRPHPSFGARRDVSVLMDSTCLPWSHRTQEFRCPEVQHPESRVLAHILWLHCLSTCWQPTSLSAGMRAFLLQPDWTRSHLHLYLSQRRIYLSSLQLIWHALRENNCGKRTEKVCLVFSGK